MIHLEMGLITHTIPAEINMLVSLIQSTNTLDSHGMRSQNLQRGFRSQTNSTLNLPRCRLQTNKETSEGVSTEYLSRAKNLALTGQ